MTETNQSPKSTLQAWNENGRLYLWGGVISAIISWIIIPLFGLLAVYCAYRLYGDEERTIPSALIGVVGGIGFLTWIIYLMTL